MKFLDYPSLRLALSVCVVLTACKDRHQSVWDTYDVRSPLRAAPSAVPVQPRYSYDNDSYYTKPKTTQFGSCSAEDIDEFSCD